MPVSDFIKTHGLSFSVERNGEKVSIEKGLPNFDKMRGENTINFLPTVGIKEGDALTFPDGKRYMFPKFQQNTIAVSRIF